MHLILLCFVVGVIAQEIKELKEQVPIISQQSNISPDGNFQWSYEGGDGTKQRQEGTLKSVGDDVEEVHQGEFSYVGDNGKTYKVSYVADENGFQPQGEHFPVGPKVPSLIAKALAYLATVPPPKVD